MTKPRAPLSFSLAIRQIIELIGCPAAARATRRAVRTVLHWSESDRSSLPRLDRAIALDRAFLAAGGGYPPILASYARQLEIDMADLLACPTALTDAIALAARETGEAVSASIHVTLSGASAAAINLAIAETEEGMGSLTGLLARLKSFLPGNGARRNQSGDRK